MFEIAINFVSFVRISSSHQDLLGSNFCTMQKSADTPSIYISYAWNAKSEEIADAIETEFQNRGVRIIRDKKDLAYKGKIRDFMDRIGHGNYVILIISNKYLRSENCMYELLQIFNNQDFYERIFPLVLDEVRIAKSTDRIELMKYWENEVAGLDKKVRELKELSNIQGVTDDINLYREIRDNIAKLTQILKDINTLNTDQHIRSDFTQLFSLIQSKIREDRKYLPPGIKQYKRLKQGALVVFAAGLLFIVFYNFPRNQTAEIINPPPDSIVRQEEVKDSQNTISEAAVVSPGKSVNATGSGNNGKEPGIQYEVTLVVPSSMANAAVYVDHSPAEILDRNLLYITLRLQKKNSSHHFEVVEGTNRCATDRLITSDLEELIMCN